MKGRIGKLLTGTLPGEILQLQLARLMLKNNETIHTSDLKIKYSLAGICHHAKFYVQRVPIDNIVVLTNRVVDKISFLILLCSH